MLRCMNSGVRDSSSLRESFSTARRGTTVEDLSMSTKKIGRDAETGKFKPVKDAQKDKKGSVVETIKVPPKKSPPPKTSK